jgi:hypothetical protein
MPVAALLKRPDAFLPIAMSLAVLTLVLVAVFAFGAGPEPDEGTAAHVFQLLIAGQLPIVLFFAATVLPRAPRSASIVLTLQAAAGLAALAPVFAFGL